MLSTGRNCAPAAATAVTPSSPPSTAATSPLHHCCCQCIPCPPTILVLVSVSRQYRLRWRPCPVHLDSAGACPEAITRFVAFTSSLATDDDHPSIGQYSPTK